MKSISPLWSLYSVQYMFGRVRKIYNNYVWLKPQRYRWRICVLNREMCLLTIFGIFGIFFSLKGDCWVVAALAAMVTQPRLTVRSIPSGQSFRADWYAGCFCFRFWQFGVWQEVIIDDRLPVHPGGRALFVHSSKSTEFWPALIEKAYAK